MIVNVSQKTIYQTRINLVQYLVFTLFLINLQVKVLGILFKNFNVTLISKKINSN